MPWNKISASIRLIMAMFRLYAGMEENWGKSVKDILKKQFPDKKAEIDAAYTDLGLGQKMLGIAMKQTQHDETKAQDAVQDAVAYFNIGTNQYVYSEPERMERWEKAVKKWDEEAAELAKKGKKPKDPRPEKPTKPEGFDFSKTGGTWEEVLNKMFSNIRTKAMSGSMKYTKREKQERSIDQAFGQRGEGGEGPKEGGEGRMPTPEGEATGVGGLSNLGQALDDKAGVLEFVQLIDDHIGDLKAFLPDDQRKLFELIFDDEVGSFGSDIQENMNQATAMKEKYPELYEKNSKRWSGYIGDLRKKLLENIWDYVDTHLTKHERQMLRDQFFSDTTPGEVRKKEKEKAGGKLDYQRGLDERKYSKFKWQEQQGSLSPEDKASMDKLKKAMTDRYKDDGGVDFDAIPAMEKPEAKNWKLYSKKGRAAASFSLEAVSSRVALAFSRRAGT